MWCGVVSLLPEMFAALNYGITGRAIQNKLLEVHFWNPREFTQDKYQTVDDRPYGGGPGMVMMAEPVQKALKAAKSAAPGEKAKVIYLSPQGKQFTQKAAECWVQENVVFLAGRYEGIDERIIALEIDEEWSLGDYILSGGEFAAMVMIDSLARLLPGALGDEASVTQDSLTSGFLKYPQYTRPAQFQGLEVPEVLLGGDHKAIARWRLKQALGRTWQKRPDLLARKTLTQQELALLLEYITEQRGG